MTTQAQIDAAANILNASYQNMAYSKKIAKAALTAAAEVGPRLDDLVAGISEENRHPETISWEAVGIIERGVRAATIERCAQVADTWAKYHKESGLAKHVLVGCAAAIRALSTEGK